MKKFAIRWTNRFSGERGFVGEIKTKEGYFINAENFKDIKRYGSKAPATTAINKLVLMESNKDNDFEIEDVDNLNITE